MLADHARRQEGWAARRRERLRVAHEFGNFIAQLAPWDWFVNPFTFRGPHSGTGHLERGYLGRRDGILLCKPDSRLACWKPSSKYRRESGPPVPDWALARVDRYMRELQVAAGHPIGWLVGEDFGTLGGRWHCHALVSGVAHLRRDEWWQVAFERFGRTRILPFDPEGGAAFYTAKYAGKQLGAIHFGGTLAGVDLSAVTGPDARAYQGTDVALSASLPREFYRLNLPRWHR